MNIPPSFLTLFIMYYQLTISFVVFYDDMNDTRSTGWSAGGYSSYYCPNSPLSYKSPYCSSACANGGCCTYFRNGYLTKRITNIAGLTSLKLRYHVYGAECTEYSYNTGGRKELSRRDTNGATRTYSLGDSLDATSVQIRFTTPCGGHSAFIDNVYILATSSAPTSAPTAASISPTVYPTQTTIVPSNTPTNSPSSTPTSSPSFAPTTSPTSAPTFNPTASPTSQTPFIRTESGYAVISIALIALLLLCIFICFVCYWKRRRNEEKQNDVADHAKDDYQKEGISTVNMDTTRNERKSDLIIHSKNAEIETILEEDGNDTVQCNGNKKKMIRILQVHFENNTMNTTPFKTYYDQNQLDETWYIELISSLRSYYNLEHDASLKLFEKVNGSKLDVDNATDLIDTFEANNSYVLDLYVDRGNDIGDDIITFQ
eukprot:269400_1